MLECQDCKTPLKQEEGLEFIVKCKICSCYNRFKKGILEDDNLIGKTSGNSKMYKKQFSSGVLYTYPYDFRDIIRLKRNSPKFGEALEKFILYDKGSLSSLEKNILYKLKVQSISKIDEKIKNLETKKKSIEILRLLEF